MGGEEPRKEPPPPCHEAVVTVHAPHREPGSVCLRFLMSSRGFAPVRGADGGPRLHARPSGTAEVDPERSRRQREQIHTGSGVGGNSRLEPLLPWLAKQPL